MIFQFLLHQLFQILLTKCATTVSDYLSSSLLQIPMTERLARAIDQLYANFSSYPGRNEIPGSPFAGDLAAMNKAIRAKPMKQLTDRDLSVFSGKVMTTWGEVSDLKHFLPRILDLTAQWKTPYDISIFFDRINMAEWKNWPEDEKQSLLEYTLALWENVVHEDSHEAEDHFEDYFVAIANFYPFFADIISIWNNDSGIAATKHLAVFIYNQHYNLFVKNKFDVFGSHENKLSIFKQWLLSESTINRLEQAFLSYENEDFAETISWAEKILREEKNNQVNK